MPRVFRVMKKDANDNLPVVAQNSLGARPQTDVDVDAQNNVQVNGKGMSVSPNWRDINHKPHSETKARRRSGGPREQQHVLLSARNRPIRAGSSYERPDARTRRTTHGNVAPVQVVQFPAYEGYLAATRPDWIEDET